MNFKRRALASSTLALTVPFAVAFGLAYGDVKVPLSYFLHPPNGAWETVVYEIRIPTVIAAALVGAILSVSGAVMQNLLRNPLVDPYIAGTAAGGEFGAVLALYLLTLGVIPLLSIYVVPVLAFSFAVLATLVSISLGKRGGIYGIVVGGVTVSYAFGSLTSVLVVLMAQVNPHVPPLTFWLLGEVVVVGYSTVAIMALMFAIVFATAVLTAREIELVTLSDEMSYSHSINPNRFRLAWLALISLATSYAVSQVGLIGFVGIMVPHLVRMLGFKGTRELVTHSAALGASITVVGNAISHGAFGVTVPLTPVLALLATPVIAFLLVRLNAGQGVEG
ncbi:MAG: FecCD family ABC transporter permease [Thermoprotei archaeon]